jgi:hypothetical protein
MPESSATNAASYTTRWDTILGRRAGSGEHLMQSRPAAPYDPCLSSVGMFNPLSGTKFKSALCVGVRHMPHGASRSESFG